MELPAPFGKYLLTAHVARGGMAELYLAKLIGPGGFEKPLVIKQILPELSGRPRFVEMFVAEAKTLVTLSHGNIVPIYELGMVGDTYFLAMDYIDGPNLGELTAALATTDSPLPVMTAAFIAAEILKGLDYAHRKGDGVIHRDLSPRNVLVSREGEVKIVDFGIAVTMTAGDPDSSQESGLPEGSFAYMSPEQARGLSLDTRTDLFSAGILLWEMCAGRPLFVRDSAETTLLAVIDGDIPRLSEVRAEVPPALDEACARALARDRDQRFATAAEFLADLSRCLYAASPPPTSAGLGALVAAAVPRIPDREAARGDIQAAVNAGDGGPTTRPMARGRTGNAAVKTFATHVAIEQALSGSASHGDLPATGRRRWLWWGAAAIAAALVIAAASARTTGRPSEAQGLDAPAAPLPSAGQKSGFDAAAPVMVDASPEPDAAPPPHKKHVPAAPPATATIKVGANPWADVYVDGARIGRAPGSWVIAAGHHRVEVVFPVPGHEDRREIDVDLTKGETRSLGVIDFSRQ